ncbi:hypothetical protein EGJ34_22105, partial [Stenotrophomonas sp. 278]
MSAATGVVTGTIGTVSHSGAIAASAGMRCICWAGIGGGTGRATDARMSSTGSSSIGGSMMKRARFTAAAGAPGAGATIGAGARSATAACSTLNGAKICSGSASICGCGLARARVAAKPLLPGGGTFSLAVSSVRPVAPT